MTTHLNGASVCVVISLFRGKIFVKMAEDR